MRRSLIPVRCVIHSSLVSMACARRSFVTTQSGTYIPVVRIFALRIAYPSSVGDIHGSTRAKTIAHCSQCVKQRLINSAEEMQEDTWEGLEWRGNRGNISGDLHPATTLSRREGRPLSWAPSADAVAGNGTPLNWRPSAHAVAGNGRPLSWAPSADAVAGRGNRKDCSHGCLQIMFNTACRPS